MNFYSQLKPILQFSEFNNLNCYTQAPLDWWVVITDVQGSTKAIEQGRYKEVNMAGASSIAALKNSLGSVDFPFVFGGDGATALVPGEFINQVKASLRAVQSIVRESSELNLRIGLVKVESLIASGHSLLVAKYQLPAGPSLAFFQGTGLDEAEKRVKAGAHLLDAGEEANPDTVLAGLSCRWAPLPSHRGKMLSLIIKATPQGDQIQVLGEVVGQIQALVDLESPDSHPIKANLLKQANYRSAIKSELALSGFRGFSRFMKALKVCMQLLFVGALIRLNLKSGKLDLGEYKSSLAAHSDFRKYDSVLRMVIDSTDDMVSRLAQYLESKRKAGLLNYGMHMSSSALMTCFVPSLLPGEHLHFVDGNDGGYALAAKALKAQMSNSVALK